jgi:hypothetical protein
MDTGTGDGQASPPQMGDGAKTVTIPADMLPGCKAGDTYTVKSMDGDNVVLEAMPSSGGDEEWGEGLTKAAPRGEM